MEASLNIKKHLKRLKFAHTPRTSDHLLLTAYVRSLELIFLASEALDKQHIGQHGFEPVIVSCLTEVFELRLSALESGDLPIDIKSIFLRLLANNFSGLEDDAPEVQILLQAILRAARSSTWNDGPAKELKVSYHDSDRCVGIANDSVVSMRAMARRSGYYQCSDESCSRKPIPCH